MNKLLATALLLFISLCLVAQNTKITFGEVPIEDIAMKVYPKDSTAEALVLYSFGETSFSFRNQTFYLTFKYHGRIKIFKKSGLDRATISIPYFKGDKALNDEYITQVKGFTYTLDNGNIVKERLAKEMIFNEKVTDNYHQIKFSHPKAVEGAVIEYAYEISTPMTVSQNPKTWYFQSDLPVKWSEYRINIPSVLYYRMIFSGYLPLHINDRESATSTRFAGESMGGTSYRLVIKDAPAFRNETHITTPIDYISKIDFELASINWPNVITKNYSLDYPSLNYTLIKEPSFGGMLQKNSFLKDIANKIKANHKDTISQWNAATTYIAQNIKWDKTNGIFPSNLKKVFEKKEGSSVDINFLLIALLRELDYDAHPLILSTRSNGSINPVYALLRKFNYVIAHVSHYGTDVLIDATDEFLKVGTIPKQCLSFNGWLVHPTHSRFVPLIPIESDKEFLKANLSILEEGELTGTITKSYSGYSGISTKNQFKELGEEKFLQETKKSKPAWVISKVDYKNTNVLESAMEASYQLTINDFTTVAGTLIYFKPMLSEGYSLNPFKESKRTYPVEFDAPIENTFLASYQLPKGYEIVELPQSISVSLPEGGGKFVFSSAQTENRITISSRLTLRKSSFLPEEYGQLKEFFDQLIAKHNEQIVLKKGN
ncbi:MAG TPA: transglutaminase [Runella sp.]|nr:transglutaminase [Runella sp.]